ncbi:glycosyltransferase family 4 protein [Pectinatus frisingensis]|uniref:glycosyltransferase family 4 protein n=1 Tax=Pectinatus frisingensis TaxID=865 RepID=UPI0018C82185|nr:glycosyltransferase family 4 protein [Pectinatus frisingensis]
MKTVVLRSNPILPDPRVEKECYVLIKNGIDVEILSWDRAKKYKIKRESITIDHIEIPINRIGIVGVFGGGIKRNLLPLVIFQIKMAIWLILHKKEYNIIHACDFDTALTGFLVSVLLKKKFIYDIFDYYVDAFSVPDLLQGVIRRIDSLIINHANAVIICAEKRIKQIGSIKCMKKLYIIHNSPKYVNIDKKSDLIKVKNSNRIKFVYVGVLQKGRFIEELIDIIEKNNNYELHIAGFGTLENKIIKSCKKNSNIIFYGRISYDQTLYLEKQCDIMTALYDPRVRNHYYAAPNKFYEALMLGKPLIMVRGTGMADVIEKNDIGEVIEFNSISLKKGINNLVERRDEWYEMADKMKNLYNKYFSWDIMQNRLLDLYRNI